MEGYPRDGLPVDALEEARPRGGGRFGRLLFRMRLAGRGAPSTTMIWPSEDPVATNRLPSWSMIETQQTPGLLAAALTAGFRSTWTMAIHSADGWLRAPRSRRQASRLPRPASFPTSVPRKLALLCRRRRRALLAVIIVGGGPGMALLPGRPKGKRHEDEAHAGQ